MNFFLKLSFCLFLFSSCLNDEATETGDTRFSRIYPDYRITAEEGRDDVTIHLRFLNGGATGRALKLTSPAMVEFDGRILEPDSSKFTGSYYEDFVQAEQFWGDHRIVLTSEEGNKYEESFSFMPMRLLTEIPDVVQRDELILQFEGLSTEDELWVVMTDTSFTSPDINDHLKLSNGQLVLSRSRLARVVNGPVYLELIRENSGELKDPPPGGGRLSTNYIIKRQFELTGER